MPRLAKAKSILRTSPIPRLRSPSTAPCNQPHDRSVLKRSRIYERRNMQPTYACVGAHCKIVTCFFYILDMHLHSLPAKTEPLRMETESLQTLSRWYETYIRCVLMTLADLGVSAIQMDSGVHIVLAGPPRHPKAVDLELSRYSTAAKDVHHEVPVRQGCHTSLGYSAIAAPLSLSCPIAVAVAPGRVQAM